MTPGVAGVAGVAGAAGAAGAAAQTLRCPQSFHVSMAGSP